MEDRVFCFFLMSILNWNCREHPDAKPEKDEFDEWFETDNQRELRQIYAAHSHMSEVLKEMNRKLDELVGRQERTLSLISQLQVGGKKKILIQILTGDESGLWKLAIIHMSVVTTLHSRLFNLGMKKITKFVATRRGNLYRKKNDSFLFNYEMQETIENIGKSDVRFKKLHDLPVTGVQTVGQTGQPMLIDTIRRQEVEAVLTNQNVILNTAREIKSFIGEVNSKADTIVNHQLRAPTAQVNFHTFTHFKTLRALENSTGKHGATLTLHALRKKQTLTNFFPIQQKQIKRFATKLRNAMLPPGRHVVH